MYVMLYFYIKYNNFYMELQVEVFAIQRTLLVYGSKDHIVLYVHTYVYSSTVDFSTRIFLA